MSPGYDHAAVYFQPADHEHHQPAVLAIVLFDHSEQQDPTGVCLSAERAVEIAWELLDRVEDITQPVEIGEAV
jgi:hypothetical protein